MQTPMDKHPDQLDTLELDTAVGLLTRESKHRLVDSEGNFRWVTADPLLLQLRVAISHSTAPATFKASAGNPLPLSATAYDLLAEIAEVTLEKWWATYRLHHGLNRETLVGQMRAWAMAARADPALLAEATHILKGWVRQIEALFDPTRHWEVKGQCPGCGNRRMLLREDEEGIVFGPVLIVAFDSAGELKGGECKWCGETWTGKDLVALAELIAAQ